jgi:hypothetical protein
MVKEDDEPKIVASDKRRLTSFEDHMRDAWEELYWLGELERKYSFFRINAPEIKYEISKNVFEMEVSYELNLHAKYKDHYIYVDFNGGGHNQLVVTHPKNSNKMFVMEAQEFIRCDSKLGYKHVYKFFEDNGIINKNKTDFAIKLNEDILKFDDHNLEHEVFRGWTGGYDPSYTGSTDPMNILNIMLKKDWESRPYMESLERRINTLKMLFDGINKYADFYIQEDVQPIKNVPDFKSKYKEMIKSEYYNFMIDFGKRLGERFKIKLRFEQEVKLTESEFPRLHFYEKNTGILFIVDDTGGYNDTKVMCELNIPKDFSERKKFDTTYLQYTDPITINGQTTGKEKNMIGAYEYLKSEKDIPKGLEKCLERLM